jgi:hypothetical protein
MTTIRLILDAGSTPAVSTILGIYMFKWFKNKFLKEETEKSAPGRKYMDSIEHALWEIKEQYDLPTEEVDIVVESKRQNVDYMHENIIKRRKDV